MAEIIQYYHKDDTIQFDIIIRARSVECHSAMSDLSDEDKTDIKGYMKSFAERISRFITYVPK